LRTTCIREPKSYTRELIIIPVLKYLAPEIPFSTAAVKLLEMTAAHESRLGTYLGQLGGPALGIYQIEPATDLDIHLNFLGYNKRLADKIAMYRPSPEQDFGYATAIARVHYYRDSEALPKHDDLIGLANYCKRCWNTVEGKASARDYYQAYEELVL